MHSHPPILLKTIPTVSRLQLAIVLDVVLLSTTPCGIIMERCMRHTWTLKFGRRTAFNPPSFITARTSEGLVRHGHTVSSLTEGKKAMKVDKLFHDGPIQIRSTHYSKLKFEYGELTNYRFYSQTITRHDVSKIEYQVLSNVCSIRQHSFLRCLHLMGYKNS